MQMQFSVLKMTIKPLNKEVDEGKRLISVSMSSHSTVKVLKLIIVTDVSKEAESVKL